MQLESYERLHGVLGAIVRGEDVTPLLCDVDPVRFSAFAARNRCAPLISSALAECPPELAPLRRALRAHEISCALKISRLRAQLNDIVAIINGRGVTPILLKGAARLWEFAPGHHLHDSVDLDLMIRPNEFSQATHALREAGYVERASPVEMRYYERRHHHAAPLFSPDGGVPVELHRELYLRDSISLSTEYEAMAPYARLAAQAPGSAYTLNAAGTALHLIVHGFGRPPLRDLYLLAVLLRSMAADERAQLAVALEAETKEPVRLAATAYAAACMAGIPWRASTDARRFAQWCIQRENLPRALYVRNDCADAVMAHPDRAVRAFLRAAIGTRPVAEGMLQSVLHQPARAVLRAVAGIRILCGLQRKRLRPGWVRIALRGALRAHARMYRTALAARSLVRRCILPRLPRAVENHIAQYPALRRFVREARRSSRRRAAFHRLLATPFITEYLNAELLRLTQDEDALGRLTEYRRSLTIVQTPEIVLRIQFLDDAKPPREILSALRTTLISPIGGSIRIRRFSVPDAPLRGIFHAQAALSERETATLSPGEMVNVSAAAEAYTVMPDAPSAAILTLEDARTESLCWRFDAASFKCLGAVSSDITVSRLRETLELASALGVRSIVAPARSLLDHPSHFVRWSALSAVARLSKRDALPMLRRATRDAHPQLRRAAVRLLAARGEQWH